MGKHGPCYHCGVTSTPLWRNGPPEKPVLCNACGSRWRTKGTLANYTPLHARPEHDEIEAQYSNLRTIATKSKESKILKRKLTSDLETTSHGVQKFYDEETSNRSSSGSAISNNESCVQYCSADASPSRTPSMWDSTVPSRKRTCFARAKQTPFEKLTKDLYTIWHQQQSSCISGSSEEGLLLESDKPMVSVEIGHGSVLIRHPNSIAREEESEASSLSFDNKLLNAEKISSSSDFIEDSFANRSSKGIQPFDKFANHGTSFRDRDQMDNFEILSSHCSPLSLIDLQDILNYETFFFHLTNEEQQKLLKFLPSVDTEGTLDSLKMMFSSSQFKQNLFSFQKLIADGVFDGSASGVISEDSKNLQKLILCDKRYSNWVEKYTELKDSKGKNNMHLETLESFNGFETVEPMSLSRAQNEQLKKLSGSNIMLNMAKPEDMIQIEKDDSLSCTKGLFPLLNDDDICTISDFKMESFENDLLVDVPSNIYPEAELLYPNSGIASISSSSAFQARFLRPR